MEDSGLFMQWAVSTLQHEHPAAAVDADDRGDGEAMFPSLQALREASHAAEMVEELIADADLANSWSSGDGDITDGSSGSNNIAPPAAMDHGVWPPSPNSASARRAPSRGGGGANQPPVSWNFRAATAQPGRDGVVEVAAAPRCPPNPVYGSPPMRRAGLKSSGFMSAPYAQDHIMAERKRREKINQRFIELSTVIPGLKKMDKATILSDATKYVKELQEKLKDLEAGGSRNGRNIETVVLVKKPCLHSAAAPDDDGGSPLSSASSCTTGRKSLPEIEARFSEKSVMVRVHCENGKGVAVKVLAEFEELHLSIVHANVMPFSPCTLIITITAKVEDGLTVTVEEIVNRLNSVFLHQHSSCNCSEETGH
ncbi:hypothetical protein ACP4OV_007729 [Aristida adscensionis]